MAEMLDDIGLFLETAGHGTRAATTGTSIVQGALFDAPDRQIAIVEGSGQAPAMTMGASSLPVIIRPALQVWVRYDPEDYSGAKTLVRAVWKTLAVVANQTINGALYHRIAPVDEPVLAERDDQERCVFLANFSVWRVVP